MKFVYFRVADDNATAWPLSKLVDVRYNDATNLDLFYNHQGGPIIKVADSVDSVFVDSNITAVASITLAS